MTRVLVKPMSPNPPEEKKKSIFGHFGWKGTLGVYAVFMLAALVSLMFSPFIVPVAVFVWWRIRHYYWPTRLVLALLIACAALLVFTAKLYTVTAVAVFDALIAVFSGEGTIGGVGHALWAGLGSLLLLGIIVGIPGGLLCAFWDWSRTPAWKDPQRRKNIAQQLMMNRHIKQLRANTYRTRGEVAYGVESGTYDDGSVVVQRVQDMLHTLILGMTGAGKTQTMVKILSAYIEDHRFLCLVDMKGSKKLLQIVEAIAKRYGRPFYVFGLNGPMHYDPLAPSAGTDPTKQKDLIISAEQWSDEFYKGVAEEYLLVLFKILEVTGPVPGKSMLESCVILLDPQVLTKFVRDNLTNPKDDALRAEAQAKADQLVRNENVVAGLRSKLGRIVNSVVGQWMSPGPDTFNLRQAYEERAVVLFSLQHMDYQQLSATIGAFVMQDLKALAGEIQTKGNVEPWLVAADEFTKIGSNAVVSMMEQVRESGARVLLASQGVGGIRAAAVENGGDPDGYLQVIWGQADTLICHTVDQETAERFARDAGMDWHRRRSHDTHESNTVFDLDKGGVGDRGRVDYVEGPRIREDQLTSGMTGPGRFALLGKLPWTANRDDGFGDRLRGRAVAKRTLVYPVQTIMDDLAQAKDVEGATVKAGEITAVSNVDLNAPALPADDDGEDTARLPAVTNGPRPRMARTAPAPASTPAVKAPKLGTSPATEDGDDWGVEWID